MVFDEIEAYLRRQQQEKKLLPGDKLPSYGDLEKMFGTSYMTVQRCLKKLEQKGVIKIVHGVGSFLNGGESLEVDLYLTPTTFDFEKMQLIVDRISRENDLNLQITLKPMSNDKVISCVQSHKAVITETDPWFKSAGTLLDYSAFADYRDVMASLRHYGMRFNNLQLPFYFTTSQGAVNLNILRKAGFTRRIDDFSTLDWWEELNRQCRACGEFPAVAGFRQADLWAFPAFMMTVLLMLQQRRDVDTLFLKPVFAGEVGKRIFKLMDTFGDAENLESPLLGGAVDLEVGSWFTLQHRRNFHFERDDFRIVPLKCGERKILKYTGVALQTFVNSSISDNEKKRLWVFLKKLVSKSVQEEIVAMTGTLSFRADMTAHDHAWADREDFLHFFPREGDYLVNTFLLSSERLAVLGALYEQYKRFGADPELIRRTMDEKLLDFPEMRTTSERKSI